MLKEVIKKGFQKETCGDKTQRCYHARVNEPWTTKERWKFMLN